MTAASSPCPAEPATVAGEPQARRALRLLRLATFGSGGCALLLEQLYEKYLATLLGASRPAATVVLATFFLGLAAGGLLCPKRPAGAARRLAGLELFIAAWAVVFGLGFFASYDAAAAWLAAAGDSPRALAAARFALAVAWILPPTIAMGAQLPTLTAVLTSLGVHGSRPLTALYTLNLLGGFAITLLAPVVLFNFLGASGALWTAAGLSAAIGTALWFGLPATGSGAAPERRETASAAGARPPRGELFLAAASGFVFFALEVLWFHLIGAVCGASTYSFSLLLAAVLLALALAGAWVSRVPSGSDAAAATLLAVLGRLLPLLAVSAAAWPHLGRVFVVLQNRLQLETFWAGELLKFLVVALSIVPPAIGLGMIFPLVLRGVDHREAGAGRRVGWICTANILGCVAGALGAGFGLIPWLGAERGFLALWLLVAAAFGWHAWRNRPRARVQHGLAWVWAALGAAAIVALPRWDQLELTRGLGVYFKGGVARDAELQFFHEDQQAGFVTVVRTPASAEGSATTTLLQNGKFDADDQSQMPAQIGFGLVSALHAPAFGGALVIGAGSGQTASVIEGFSFGGVEIAELSPGHLRAARERFAHLHGGVFDRANVDVIVDDGRNWLLRSPCRYDVIQIEISSVWFAGATNLYAREFYALARQRLAPGGLVMQWVQLHHLTERELGAIIATMQSELPEISIWRVGSQACLLGSLAPQQLNPEAWHRWTTSPRFAAERAIFPVLTPDELAHCRLLAPADVRRLLARRSYTINTDRNRWLEFQTPKHYLSPRDHAGENLRWLAALGRDPSMGVHTPPVHAASR